MATPDWGAVNKRRDDMMRDTAPNPDKKYLIVQVWNGRKQIDKLVSLTNSLEVNVLQVGEMLREKFYVPQKTETHITPLEATAFVSGEETGLSQLSPIMKRLVWA